MSATRHVLDGLNTMTRDWQRPRWDEAELWRELVACILGSVVPFEAARTRVTHLESVGILKEARQISCHPSLESRLSEELARPLRGTAESDLPVRYRFPHLRAKHISRTAEAIYGTGRSLRAILDSSPDERIARSRIVEIAYGIGPKQASLFLRNIGHAQRLAILDVHVLRFMTVVGLTNTPASAIQSISVYEQFERRFQEFADDECVGVGLLDVAIWVVMRVYKREGARWHL